MVRHENDGDALGTQAINDGEEPLGLACRQRSRRLIEDQDAAFTHQRAGNFDQLAMRYPERFDWPPDVDVVQPDASERLTGLVIDGLVVDDAEAFARNVLETDILGHRRIGQQVEFLVHDLDAMRLGIGRGVGFIGGSVESDLAVVPLDDAAQDLDERRLAGTVFADQRVHLASPQREGDAVQRDDAAKTLAYVRQFQHRTRRISGCPGGSTL